MLYNTSISFPYLFSDNDGQTQLDTNFTSINRSIALILLTGKGELLGNPEFGSNLKLYQFNEVTPEVVALLTDEIIQAITDFENRITLDTNNIQITQELDTVKINISYTLKNSDITGQSSVIYPIPVPNEEVYAQNPNSLPYIRS